jgi:hypothetical protein
MLMTTVLQGGTLELVGDRLQALLSGVGGGALLLLVAVALVLVGWLVARIVSRLVLALLRALRFNDGLRGVMGEAPDALRHEPAAMVAWAVHWTLVVLAVMLAADVVGLDLTASVASRLQEAAPRVAAATIEFAVGVAVAMALGAATRRLFETAGFKGARLRGQIVTLILSAFAVLVALEQLGLAAQFIMALGITVMGAAALAAGLAFGLGCRELARDFIVEYLRTLDEPPSRRP